MIQEEPSYLNILVDADKRRYGELRNFLRSEKMRYQRFHRMDTFDQILDEIRKFCIQGDEDDWKRCLVCGVCWMNGYTGINVKQLRYLTDKSKSNINGVLAKLGYIQVQSIQLKKELIETIPFLKGNYLEQRFWTIRSNPLSQHSNSNSSDSASSPELSVSSPEQYQSQTPQPYMNEKKYNLVDMPKGEEIQNMFSVLDLKIRDGAVCGLDPSEIDFFADPICCIPAGLMIPCVNSNELLSFG